VYSTNHPYGRSMLEPSVKAITRDDLVAFHRSYYQPGRAVITVVGDVKPDEVKRTIEQALAGWKAGGSMPSFDYPTPPSAKSTTIYLVDKPAAAQSTFTIGSVGPPRSTADYYALRVMNEMLGALFQSRLNHNIREVKGYSYGVNSSFAFGRGPGPFRAGGDIVTGAATVIEAMGAGRKAARGMKAYLGLRDEVPTNEAVPLIFGIARGERNFARVRAL